mmetsp:Transcript_36503/g.117212  ORF Transcript_36503/g.117212 Transcript_36503/m.117212 type:complete len:360 (+) Transcript_36503:211-1290(+)
MSFTPTSNAAPRLLRWRRRCFLARAINTSAASACEQQCLKRRRRFHPRSLLECDTNSTCDWFPRHPSPSSTGMWHRGLRRADGVLLITLWGRAVRAHVARGGPVGRHGGRDPKALFGIGDAARQHRDGCSIGEGRLARLHLGIGDAGGQHRGRRQGCKRPQRRSAARHRSRSHRCCGTLLPSQLLILCLHQLPILEHSHPAVAHRRVGTAGKRSRDLPPPAPEAAHAVLNERVLARAPHGASVVGALDAGVDPLHEGRRVHFDLGRGGGATRSKEQRPGSLVHALLVQLVGEEVRLLQAVPSVANCIRGPAGEFHGDERPLRAQLAHAGEDGEVLLLAPHNLAAALVAHILVVSIINYV